MKPQYFPIVYTVINIWRNFGWGSILYLSSMASIDPTLYEAASLDGANRWHKIWHVTLPAIKPTIVVMLIMGVGGMLGADSDMILLLYNPATYEYADVIGTYLYRYGLVGGNFSYIDMRSLTRYVTGTQQESKNYKERRTCYPLYCMVTEKTGLTLRDVFV